MQFGKGGARTGYVAVGDALPARRAFVLLQVGLVGIALVGVAGDVAWNVLAGFACVFVFAAQLKGSAVDHAAILGDTGKGAGQQLGAGAIVWAEHGCYVKGHGRSLRLLWQWCLYYGQRTSGLACA